jgi:CheY-like chemotaxis protein
MAKKHKILIAEDDISLLDLYTKKFTNGGYEVVRAEDGGQAVEKIKAELPDAIVLDIMMPVLDGFGVLKRIKADSQTEDIPVVILSNFGEMPKITEGLMNGAVEYLIKVEHTPDEVMEVVANAITERDSLIGKAFKETS